MFNIKNPPKFLSISLTFVLVSIALLSFSQSKLSQLVIQSKPAIFSITCFDKSDIPFSYGTGFFIDSEGIGLTNYHVLEGASYAVIKTLDGNHYKIDQIISQNKKIDLIKFKVKKTSKIFPYLKLCPTSPIEAEEVLVIGNPKELEYSVSNGIISSLRNDEEMGKVIQITAPISSGSSGSPLLNLKGELLGVISFTMKEGQNLNFAVSVDNLGKLIPNDKLDFPASEETKKVSTDSAKNTDYWKGILVSYNDSIKINPKNPVAFFSLGCAKLNLKDYNGAIEDLTKAIELDANFSYLFYLRGRAKSAIKDEKGSIVDFTKAIKLDPEFEPTYRYRALSKCALGDYKGGIEDYSKAIELDDDNATTFYERSLLRGNSGEDPKAILADLSKAIELDSTYEAAYIFRGLTNGLLKDSNGAIKDFTKAIELNPENYKSLEYRANTKVRLKDYLGAIVDYTKAIELNSQSTFLFSFRGEAKLNLDDYRGAIIDYNEAITLNPKYDIAYINRGIAYLNLRQIDKACINFSKAGELGYEKAYDYIKKYCNN
jgi:tetratricopeptide (TPR) repeat protein